MSQSSSAAVRIGILGAANIARAFIAGVQPSSRVLVAAVSSRTPEKAERFARETGVARFHGAYEALLADPQIDAVYIPLPNSLHAKWAIRACEAGKHVLCEKPLCTTGASPEESTDIAMTLEAILQSARSNTVVTLPTAPWSA